ncbi:response regulator [Roseovarius sp. S4756]|uniref:response regulator n=1 Tax=Roseovarius maritimus TaxID=3342637 RepID=UPI00372BA365
MNILLVDDDPTFSDIIAAKLEQLGHVSLTLASSAEHALQLVDATSAPFDCFILDIMMGEIDGIELCRRLRQQSRYKTTPIIMVTASLETPLMDQAFHAGATDFLRKPLDEVELAGRITTAMLLVDALKREKAGRDVLHSVLTSRGAPNGFDISKRICFYDVPGMMDYHELENRLLRFQDGLYQINVFRILIPTFQKACRDYDHADVLQRLRAVSEAVSDAVPGSSLLMSYIGRGRFICCILGRAGRVSAIFQNSIQANICSTLKTLSLKFNDKVEVSIDQLNDHQILSRAAAAALVRNEYEMVSSFALESPLQVDEIEDNIFLDTDWLACDAVGDH